MIGVGFYLLTTIRIVTFGVVFVVKIMHADDQNEETKNTLKFVGGLTLLFLVLFVLIQCLYWLNTSSVLGRHLSWIVSLLILGKAMISICFLSQIA